MLGSSGVTVLTVLVVVCSSDSSNSGTEKWMVIIILIITSTKEYCLQEYTVYYMQYLYVGVPWILTEICDVEHCEDAAQNRTCMGLIRFQCLRRLRWV